jgi:histidinol-phosphate aminotransferase
MNVLKLARPHLLALEPYRSARSLATDGSIFLDANENPRVLSQDPLLAAMNRYPSPQPPKIVHEAARYYGVAADRVLVTRGADEGIDLLVRTFTEPGREDVLVTPPTYGVYAIAAALHGAGVVSAPLVANQDFAFAADAVVEAARARPVKLVFICRPNNPTGSPVDLGDVERVAAALAERALVVVDEAYLEFSAEASAASLTARFPNVVVLKTLSKAWGLAGARCGFLLADPAIVGLMQTVRPPYPISTAAARAVEAVFNEQGEAAMRRSVAEIVSERQRLTAALRTLPAVTRVLESRANSVLGCFKNKDAALTALRARGIIVRDRSGEPGLGGGIRFTVGLPAENAAVLDVLRTIAG